MTAPFAHTGIIHGERLTVEAAAQITGYNPQYLRRMCYDGRLEAIRVSRIWLISRLSLRDYIQEGAATGDARFGPRQPVINYQQDQTGQPLHG